MIGMMVQAGQDAFDFWRRVAETASASAFVIDRRSRVLTPGHVPTPADLAEMGLMVPEKLTAFGLANLALLEAWYAGTAASWASYSEILAPIHARATANARRLRRQR
jgi:hypothetical protein